MGDRDLTILPREFYERPVLEVARELLGCIVRGGGVSVRLTEVEAYAGGHDPASHGFRGRTPRTEVMFGPAGHAYVYFTYGMHFCVNVVTGRAGEASAVLLRAGEVVAGVERARERRGPTVRDRDLARGPARLTVSLGLDRSGNGADLTRPRSAVQVLRGQAVPDELVRWGPRVGVSSAKELPWRAWIDGDTTVSPYRPHAPKKRRAAR